MLGGELPWLFPILAIIIIETTVVSMYMIQYYLYILTTLISYYMLLHTTYGGFLKWVSPQSIQLGYRPPGLHPQTGNLAPSWPGKFVGRSQVLYLYSKPSRDTVYDT